MAIRNNAHILLTIMGDVLYGNENCTAVRMYVGTRLIPIDFMKPNYEHILLASVCNCLCHTLRLSKS